ncbi:MAG: sulfur oxidation c-type cytochrome SoxA [Hyphomicrobiaceae bacterium]
MECYRLAGTGKTGALWLAVAVAWLLLGQPSVAQLAPRGVDETDRGLETFRNMMKSDPWANPGNLDVDRGAELWKAKRGKRKVSLEGCDLGKGPGVVDGAFAELPRYFADAGQVMDLESRVLWCMETVQGLDMTAFLKKPHPSGGQPVGDLGAIATYVASRSSGLTFAATLEHPREKLAVAMGEAIFNRRSGPFDFSCASCHGSQGKRIRRQGLAFLSLPEEARTVVGEWPAYRVSATHVMTLQHRLYDCFWQMRLPPLRLGSPASIALTAYLVSKANGGPISAPGLKR